MQTRSFTNNWKMRYDQQNALEKRQNNDLRVRNVSHNLLLWPDKFPTTWRKKNFFHKLCNSISLQDSHGFYRLATSFPSVRENWYLAHVSNFPLGIQSISQLKTAWKELEKVQHCNISFFSPYSSVIEWRVMISLVIKVKLSS